MYNALFILLLDSLQELVAAATSIEEDIELERVFICVIKTKIPFFPLIRINLHSAHRV
jgi:hypothetical protein